MKSLSIFVAFYTTSVVVKGALWAAAVQPVMLSIGAFLAAIDLDVIDIKLPFINKQDATVTTEAKKAADATEATIPADAIEATEQPQKKRKYVPGEKYVETRTRKK